MTTPQPGLLSIPATQEQLGGLGRTKVFELIKHGHLATVKIGSRRFVVASSVAEFIETHAACAR